MATPDSHMLHRVYFAEDVQAEIEERANRKDQTDAYQGPDVVNMQKKVFETISLLTWEFQVNQIFFRNMYNLSIGYEQKFYI